LSRELREFTPTQPEATRQPQKSLWQIYGDPEALRADAEKRPEHYSDEQKQWIRILNQEEPGEVKEHQAADLLLQYVRRAEAARTTRDSVSRATKPMLELESSFEEQGFGAPLPGDVVFA
jgi:hypothetical protein